jgi:hypothetical protein
MRGGIYSMIGPVNTDRYIWGSDLLYSLIALYEIKAEYHIYLVEKYPERYCLIDGLKLVEHHHIGEAYFVRAN